MTYSKHVCILLTILILAGCSVKAGGFVEQTHFDYPNSNIVPLGNVKAEISKTGFFIPRTVDGEDVQNLMKIALAQRPGADMIINAKFNTKVTNWILLFPPFTFYTTYITLEGTAANMTIGEQELEELKSKGY